MKTNDFFFDLPKDLIAQYPAKERGLSRMLVMDRGSGSICHSMVKEIAEFLEAGSLLIFNDSRVRKARIFGIAKDTGARVEFLLTGRVDQYTWRAICSKKKKQSVGKIYAFPGDREAEITVEDGKERLLRFDKEMNDDWLDLNGHIPLPPYIKREDEGIDQDRYQNIFSRDIGSVAAPTAGLHFTDDILKEIERKGIGIRFVTLHVGLGTFLPVRSERVEDHKMHSESFTITKETADDVKMAKAEGRKIVAVGTTSVRTLESAWDDEKGELRQGEGNTNIFIYPGYRFKVIDALFTNFHTPESSLLMLVSAFAGKEKIDSAYKEAIREGYRFFSYGDAMFIK